MINNEKHLVKKKNAEDVCIRAGIQINHIANTLGIDFSENYSEEVEDAMEYLCDKWDFSHTSKSKWQRNF